MKKVFKLQVENKNPERQLESVKNEIRKYLKRERKKKLPENAVFWDFACRFGEESSNAENVTTSELISALDKAYEAKWPSCYVEIMSNASMKRVVTTEETEEEE